MTSLRERGRERGRKNRAARRKDEFEAFIGKWYADGSVSAFGVGDDALPTGETYVTLYSEELQGLETKPAVCVTVTPKARVGVVCHYNFKNELEVLRLSGRTATGFLGPAVYDFAAPPKTGVSGTNLTAGRDYFPGRVIVYVPGTLKVNLAEPYPYIDSDGNQKVWVPTVDNSLDLATSNVPSSGLQRWVQLTLNKDATTPALVAFNGTTQSSILPPGPQGWVNITITDGFERLDAVLLKAGDTSEATVTDDRWAFARNFGATDTATSLADATTTDLGGVLLDENPASGSPIALTAPRLGAPYGVALLGGDQRVPSLLLPVGEDAGITEPLRWTRAPAAILTASEAWENDAVYEPCVFYEDGTWLMLYNAGWGSPSFGLATCTDDPTIAANWTKYAGNPVFTTGTPGNPSVMRHQGIYHLFYASAGAIKLATSPDLINWTIVATVLPLQGSITQWANTAVWVEAGAAEPWKMLAEGRVGAIWITYLATSTDGLTFTLANSGNPLTTLQVAVGGMYGGPHLPHPHKVDGLYHLWYHAAQGAGNTPTNLYRATSPDLITWTRPYGTTPVLTHSGVDFEIDQVADPECIEVNGKSYLFYDGVDNPNETASIGLATWDGPLSYLLNEAEWPLVGGVEGVTGTSPITVDNTDPDNPIVTHATSGVTPGTYTCVTVDNKGHVTAGTNPVAASSGEVLMVDGVTPPEPMTTEDETDWLYEG